MENKKFIAISLEEMQETNGGFNNRVTTPVTVFPGIIYITGVLGLKGKEAYDYMHSHTMVVY